MKLELRYETVYRYEQPVSLSPHEVRLFPRADRFSRVRRFGLKVNGDSVVRFSRDVFDNVVASCFFPARLPELRFEVEIDLDLDEKDAFDFILQGDAVEMPFVYEPELARVLAPYLQRQTTDALTKETDPSSALGFQEPSDQTTKDRSHSSGGCGMTSPPNTVRFHIPRQ